jgi:putative transposase
MARRKRWAPAGAVQHVYNRGSRKGDLFEFDDDYSVFLNLLEEARAQRPMRILAYCLMPNHWHLLLWPEHDGDLSRYMHWLTTTHAHYFRHDTATQGQGAVYQSRFNAVPMDDSWHLLIVRRYIERNALEAKLCDRAEAWPWSSAGWTRHDNQRFHLDRPPFPLPVNWLEALNDGAAWEFQEEGSDPCA